MLCFICPAIFFGLFFPLHWMNRSLCFSTIDKTQVKIKSIPTLIRGATAEGHVGCNKPWVIFQQVGKLDPEAALLAREDISAAAAAAAKLRQSCPTLCNPIDGSPTGSSVPGILQARILEWVAISFSNAWKWKVKVKSLSRVRLLVTPWTAAYQAPPSMGFSRQEFWSGVPLPSPISAAGHI